VNLVPVTELNQKTVVVVLLVGITKKVPKTHVVNNVLHNVTLVLIEMITVLIVKKTESMLKFLNVHVQCKMDSMKSICKLIVHHVIQLVLPVPYTSHVFHVNKTLTELPHQNVHVKMDISKKVSNVLPVLIHVLPVLMTLGTV
jgi:chromate transport protein ChrA